MNCVCWAIQRVNGQDKIFKCVWTGYGNSCQAHRFVSRTATLLGFSHSTVSRVYQERSTTRRTSSQPDRTVGNIGINMGQHETQKMSVLIQYRDREVKTILHIMQHLTHSTAYAQCDPRAQGGFILCTCSVWLVCWPVIYSNAGVAERDFDRGWGEHCKNVFSC